ncbi:MAG TPA: energy-coupling factor transporter ATPase [Firmicutes bacterium]|nr:energy-coupling factor transporter ATPase [Candidatus Fermentithermobacillaceae bacterium]
MNGENRAVVAETLVHTYGPDESSGVVALAGVDLEIKQGEFVCIIGPNGSGKSTLARHFNALLLPTSGRVLVFGMDTRDERNLWEIRRTAGMVFQNPDNQMVATVVEEDVAFGPENLGIKPDEIRQRVSDALKAVGMEGFSRASPHFLSGGQKQRVAIAGILAMMPSVIVLDEPTAMLDPKGRREVMETLTKLNKEKGITVVHITHHMDEAVHADRVIVMYEGKVVLSGSPTEVFSKTEDLAKWGLDVPFVERLGDMLRKSGYEVSRSALTVEEMVDELCRLSSST